MSTHLIVGRTGSGKTHQLQRLIDKAAADPTTTTWAIEPAGIDALTGADRHTRTGAAEQLLTDALAAIDRRRTKQHTPSETEPRILLLIDAAEHLLRRTSAAELLHRVVTTGRPAAVDTVVAASEMRLVVWPCELRDHYLLSGDLTVLGRPLPDWPLEIHGRIADGTATIIDRPANTDA